jgi:Flp pilus assembly protein TadG
MNHRLDATQHRDTGSIAVIVALAIVPMFAVLAAVVEGGTVMIRRQELQTGVEAAALHAAEEWLDGRAPCAGVETDIARNHNATSAINVSCTASGSSYGGSITITADTSTDLTLGTLIGRDAASISSSATVAVGNPAALIGLRPLALCAQHPALASWITSGFTDDTIHTIRVESNGTTCGGDVPGNWAMMDFDGGSNSNATLQNWVVNGYPGEVIVPSSVPGDPGIPTPAIDVDVLIGSVITLPVFDSARLNGSTAEFDLNGFVSVEVIDVVMTGAAASRHIDLRFVTDTAGESVTDSSGFNHYGISSWRLCALDGNGTCS